VTIDIDALRRETRDAIGTVTRPQERADLLLRHAADLRGDYTATLGDGARLDDDILDEALAAARTVADREDRAAILARVLAKVVDLAVEGLRRLPPVPAA